MTSRPSEFSQAFSFFDVDDTLISIKSMFHFFEYYCLNECKDPALFSTFEGHFQTMHDRGLDRTKLNQAYYRYFKGWRRFDIDTAGRRWWHWVLTNQPDIMNAPVLNCLNQHRAQGREPVLISGSCRSLLLPIARTLGGAHILAAPLVVDHDNKFTGELGQPQTIGEGKREAIQIFLSNHNGDRAHSYAYGDDISDLPMLSAVGHPVAVGGGTPLADVAQQQGWDVIELLDKP